MTVFVFQEKHNQFTSSFLLTCYIILQKEGTVGEQVCRNPKCGKTNPKIAKFCMHCGLKIHINDTSLWPGEILEVAEKLNPKQVVDIVLANVDSRHIDFDTKKVTRADIVKALSKLTQKNQQVLIRLTGADGNGVRGVKETAEEAGVKVKSLQSRLHHFFFMFALKLRDCRPSGNYSRRERRARREFRIGLANAFNQLHEKLEKEKVANQVTN